VEGKEQNFSQWANTQGEKEWHSTQASPATSVGECSSKKEETFQQLIRESQNVPKTQQVFPADVEKQVKLGMFFYEDQL